MTTQEEKELLLTDLCARLPYGFIVHRYSDNADIKINTIDDFSHFLEYSNDEIFKPYLRPLSLMTEEEFEKLKEYSGLKYEQLDLASFQNGIYKCLDFYLSEIPADVVILVFDWLNAHHFDYRGLIPMGLALKASEGMYNIKEK